MKKHYLFHLGHPAHYQLFKNVIKSLINHHKVTIVIKKKDVLEQLLKNDDLSYHNLLPNGRSDSKFGILTGMIKTDLRLLVECIKNRPDLLIGTSYAIAHVGKILGIPSLNVNEDDYDAVPLYSKLSYPWSTVILAPETCNTGKWAKKCISYKGYHELAYLHPKRFKADIDIAAKYVEIQKPYFILRFALLKAHHDKGVSGISDMIASELIRILETAGNVYITSERVLPANLEKYRLKISPNHIHHVMSFATMYIGDSQTMAAEAGVLGVPFIRCNDFVGKLGYLKELEETYKLGYGIKPSEEEKIFSTVYSILSKKKSEEWKSRREKMLADKIDLTAFMLWIIENYPNCIELIQKNPGYQNNFK